MRGKSPRSDVEMSKKKKTVENLTMAHSRNKISKITSDRYYYSRAINISNFLMREFHYLQ